MYRMVMSLDLMNDEQSPAAQISISVSAESEAAEAPY
jgi:hypothetical protein